MTKKWLSFAKQVEQLQNRGLEIASARECEKFLAQVNYTRFEGYFSYWRTNPKRESRFVPGADFETIRDLFEADRLLASTLETQVRKLEALFRTQYAHAYGQLFGGGTGYLRGEGLSFPPQVGGRPATPAWDLMRGDLNRSKEYIIRSRYDETGDTYPDLPIWVAVEAFTFGTLSKAIAASVESGVLAKLAANLGLSQAYLPGQLKLLVHLRNRLAHCGRLWNHVTLDKAGMLPKTVNRYKNAYGDFADNSVFRIICLIDLISKKAELEQAWLEQQIMPILNTNLILKQGIMNPQRYGEFPFAKLEG